MNIYDMHIHCANRTPDPAALLDKMGEAGVYGGCVFSNRPNEAIEYGGEGTSFEERLAELKGWTAEYPDRLFPVLWIHPYEENILDKIDIAIENGVVGFKIICTDFYVSDPACMDVLRLIAKRNKPVFFHSGILWTGAASSKYNRPVFWEALLDIEGLRFSMGHCGWPWIDECIALYGQFRYAAKVRNTSEMFLDLTPGTPPIYRRELLTKLLTVDFGFDTRENILFGTDCSSHHYRPDSVIRKLMLDGQIMDELGVDSATRQLIYQDNLMRFLGRG